MFECAGEAQKILWFYDFLLSSDVVVEFHRYTMRHNHKYICSINCNFENIFFVVSTVDELHYRVSPSKKVFPVYNLG
jgi:hypothetical protein